jgi:hypothetical protein
MRRHLLVVCLAAVAAFGCRNANPEQQLKDSFLQQIAATENVRDFQRNGDEVSFSTRYGENPGAKWRVHIDSASVERQADGKTPYKGTINSTWSVNGEPIRPRGDQSDLPLAFLDNGLAQECWAFWDDKDQRWSWM